MRAGAAAMAERARGQRGEGAAAGTTTRGQSKRRDEGADGSVVSESVSTIFDKAQGTEYSNLLSSHLDPFPFESPPQPRSQSAEHAETKTRSTTQSKLTRSAPSPTKRYPKSKSFPTPQERTHFQPHGYSSNVQNRHGNQFLLGQRRTINSQKTLKYRNRTESTKCESNPEIKLMKIFESKSFRNGLKPKEGSDNETDTADLSSIESLLNDLPINDDLREYFEDLLDTTLHSNDDLAQNKNVITARAVPKPSNVSTQTVVLPVNSALTKAPRPNQVQIEPRKEIWKNPLYKSVKSKYLVQRKEFFITKTCSKGKSARDKSRSCGKITPKLVESQIEMIADSSLELLERNLTSPGSKKLRTLRKRRWSGPTTHINGSPPRRHQTRKQSNPKRKFMSMMENQGYEKDMRCSLFFQSLRNMASLNKRKQREIIFNVGSHVNVSKGSHERKCKVTLRNALAKNSKRRK